MATYHRHWGWAGFCFGLALIAYFPALPLFGLSVLAIIVFHLRRETWQHWLMFCLAGIAPALIVEAIFFFYVGQFLWTRSTFGLLWKYSGATATVSHPYWSTLIESILGSNGWALSISLASGVFAPFVVRHRPAGFALTLTAVGIALFYILQSIIGRSSFVARLLVPSYLLWSICAAIILARAVNFLPALLLRRITSGILVAGLLAAVINTSLFIHEFTQTAYPQIETWFIQAAQAKRPIRYQGNMRIALFYATI